MKYLAPFLLILLSSCNHLDDKKLYNLANEANQIALATKNQKIPDEVHIKLEDSKFFQAFENTPNSLSKFKGDTLSYELVTSQDRSLIESLT